MNAYVAACYKHKSGKNCITFDDLADHYRDAIILSIINGMVVHCPNCQKVATDFWQQQGTREFLSEART